MIKLFKNFTTKDRLFLLTALLLIIGQVWLELLLPFYMRTITLLVQTPGNELGQIMEVGGLMLLAALGSLTLSFIVAVIIARKGVAPEVVGAHRRDERGIGVFAVARKDAHAVGHNPSGV